jgi:hypothetical protein
MRGVASWVLRWPTEFLVVAGSGATVVHTPQGRRTAESMVGNIALEFAWNSSGYRIGTTKSLSKAAPLSITYISPKDGKRRLLFVGGIL